MSEASGILPRQTVVLNSGREVSRTVRNVEGPVTGYQTGDCGLYSYVVFVYRDNKTDVRWFEEAELPDIDESDVSHRQDHHRETSGHVVA